MSYYEENKRWSVSTGLIFWGGSIQIVFNFIGLGLFLYFFSNLSDIFMSGIMPSIASRSLDYYENRISGFVAGEMLCMVISFLAYIIYLAGICLFKGAQTSTDAERRARNIMLTELIMPGLLILLIVLLYNYMDVLLQDVSSLVMLGIVVWGGSLAAIVFLIYQYRGLRRETTWSEKAKKGADEIKLSYSMLIWMQVVLMLGLLIIIVTIYGHFTNLQSMRYDSYGYNSFNNVIDRTQSLIESIKVVGMFTLFIITVINLFYAIARIKGWYMIQNGGLKEEFVNLSLINSGSWHFCHKCGTKLPQGSSFCPSCGTPVAEFSVSAEGDRQETDIPEEVSEEPEIGTTVEYDEIYDDDYDEYNTRRKKRLLWGGIAAGAVVIALTAWLLSDNDNVVPNAHVLATRSTVFNHIEDGVGIEPLEELKYGTPVEYNESDSGAGDSWVKVSYKNDGKVKKGYMARTDLIESADFQLLEKAGLSDEDINFSISFNPQRRAILDALKKSTDKLIIETVDHYGNLRANTTDLQVSGAKPSETCFGFIMHDVQGNRTFFLYSTPDLYSSVSPGEPVYLYSEPVKEGKKAATHVKFRKKGNKYEVSYLKEPTAQVQEEPVDSPSSVDSYRYEGKIDGKYEIVMELTNAENGEISGSYYYKSMKSPVSVKGAFNGEGLLVIEGDSDSSVKDIFIGSFGDYEYSGTWIKADGTTELPFNLTRSL